MTAIFFNLLVNSIFSLAGGLLVVGFFLWFFRVQTGPWKLFFLSLPFLKIVYDCVRGVPANSVLLSGIDPFSLPPRHQFLIVDGGLSYWGPIFNLSFSVDNLDGKRFATSIGDYLVIWLDRKFGPQVPLIIVVVVIAVAAILLTRRLWYAFQFERRRRADRQWAHPLMKLKLGLREVDVYRSDSFSGTPFTGGLLKPYICIPGDAYTQLTHEETHAVIAHEMGHVRQFDLITSVFIQLLGDLFWFVPGYRWLSRKIDRLREMVADQWAVKSGIEPALLASSLVKLKDIPETPDRFVLYSAFFREKSLLAVRVNRLLERSSEKEPRFGWKNPWIRWGLSVWIFTAVMVVTLGGNHRTSQIHSPVWLDQLLTAWGLM